MTSEKLTARLSDGTEWEVLSTAGPTCGMLSGVPYRDETIRVELKPLKPSPPKELYVAIEKATGLCGGARLTGIGKLLNPDYMNFRYILAPESGKEPECTTCGKEMARICGSNKNYFCRYCVEPKPAREWWLVYVNLLGRLVVFDSKKKAHETYPLHKVVHVREVV